MLASIWAFVQAFVADLPIIKQIIDRVFPPHVPAQDQEKNDQAAQDEADKLKQTGRPDWNA